MKLRNTTLVRRGDILNCGAGITRRGLERALESGALKPVAIKGYRISMFRRADVVKVFGLDDEPAK